MYSTRIAVILGPEIGGLSRVSATARVAIGVPLSAYPRKGRFSPGVVK
jgi:hypothetical protein